MAMSQSTFELGHPALPRFEKLAQVRQQRRQRCEDRRSVLHLVDELAPAPEALPRLEMMPQVRVPAGQSIQLTELGWPESTRKSSSGQTQRLTDGADAHSGEPIYNIVRPTQRRQRHRCQFTDELRLVGNNKGLADTSSNEGRQRCGCQRYRGFDPDRVAVLIERADQPIRTVEQMQTPLHFQQKTVWRYQAHAGREPLGTRRQLLESRFALQREDVRTYPQLRGIDRLARGIDGTQRRRARGKPDNARIDLANYSRPHAQLPAASKSSSTEPRTPPLLFNNVTRTP
jgi:hypothetical protein